MRGNISGRQPIEYAGGDAYSITDGDRVSSDNYQPRMVAAVRGLYSKRRVKYFSVRTKTTVNMSVKMRESMAIMGGAGAIFASLIRNKETLIYAQCVAAKPVEMTLRAFVFPLLKSALTVKAANIAIADGVSIVNPWVSSDTPNVPVDADVLDKFSSVLSN